MCKTIPIGTNLKCEVCGTVFVNTSKTKPRTYCSDNCKDFSKFLHAMERCLIQINFNNKAPNQVKGDLFRIANLIKCN